MKWVENDIQQYLSAKEYIDTALIPLVPFSVHSDEEMIKTAFQQELMTLYTHQLEQKLKGRVFLIPNYNYEQHAEIDTEVTRVNALIESVNKLPFKHIFLFTFDKQWRKQQTNVNGELIWLPAIQKGNLQSKELREVVSQQINDLEELIKEGWS